MKKTLFAGCSYTAGEGFELYKQAPELWVNLLHKNVPELMQTELLNVSQSGRSNAGIFQDAVFHILNNDVDYVFVAWTSMPRYEVSLGIENYSTRTVFLPGRKFTQDYNLNEVTYNKEYLQNVNDRFTTLAHVHFEIVNMVYCVNSLIALSKIKNFRLFFINAHCPWDQNYFDYITDVLPNAYTDFTKKLLNIDNRDDTQIFELYNKLHNDYQHSGSIQQEHWLNLYQSFKSLQTDVNLDELHPGTTSNHNFFHHLKTALESKI